MSILNQSTGQNVIEHYDGTQPSAFTSSSYKGMTLSSSDQTVLSYTAPSTVSSGFDSDVTVKSFIDLCEKAKNWDEFWILFGKNWWTMFWWFSFE